MEPEKILELIGEKSEEVFGIKVPLGKIKVHFEDKERFRLAKRSSAVLEKIQDKKRMKSRLHLFTDEECDDLESLDGYISLRLLANREVGYDITILVDEGEDSEEKQYDTMSSIAHEIGHAIMFEYRKRRFLEGRLERKYARWCGIRQEAFRNLRAILTDEELKGGLSTHAFDIKAATERAELDCIISAVNTFKEQHYPRRSDKGTKKRNRQEYILSLREQILQASRKLVGLQDKFFRKFNRTPENVEGWACYFAEKIMEQCVMDLIRQRYPEAGPQTILALSRTGHDRIPMVRCHKESMEYWRESQAPYGTGLNHYSSLDSVEKAKEMAKIA
jgi:hypothetical protein